VYKDKKILAIITARSESKRLPGKNLKRFMRRPLIAWTIDAAKESRYIDRIIVSSDSDKIAGIAREYGGEAPFLRPASLARDKSKSIDAVLHALTQVKRREKKEYDLIILLQPTSPLRRAGDIDKAVKLLLLKNADSVVSVCNSRGSRDRRWVLDRNGYMRKQKKKNSNHACYKVNGAIYAAHGECIKKQKSFFGRKTFAYIMPEKRSVDIDNAADFKLAETLKRGKGSTNGK